MNPPDDLRSHADLLVAAALRAAEPRQILEERVAVVDGELRVEDETGVVRTSLPLRAFQSVHLLAVGKAAPAMAATLSAMVGDRPGRRLVVAPHALVGETLGAGEVVGAGHPLPDDGSIAAGRAATALAEACGPRDLLLVALSGGASALLEAPAADLTLSDLIATNAWLLRSGLPIERMNAVRKHLSRLKGGGLVRLAQPATVLTLVLSDVAGGRIEVVGSGPTCADPTTFSDAYAILGEGDGGPATADPWSRQEPAPGERGGGELGGEPEGAGRLPPRVRTHLERGRRGFETETLKPDDPALANVTNVMVASNARVVDAVRDEAARWGYGVPAGGAERLEGDAGRWGQRIAADAMGLTGAGGERCLVHGGETIVRVTGSGRGGRAQELALAAALGIDGVAGIVIGCIATDGVDGPTQAAGAIVDGGTAGRIRAAGLDPGRCLADNDSHTALSAAGDVVYTGPTGTNLNDVAFALVLPPEERP